MYGVKAAETLTMAAGQLGSRLANRANMGFAAGRESRQGPTPEMLRAYYRTMTILTGDLNTGIFGPNSNRSQNDIALFNDFLTNAAGQPQPRGLFIQGDGIGQSEKSVTFDPVHTAFLTDKLGVIFRSPSYQSLSGNLNDCADLLTTTALTTSGDIYGVANNCAWSNDVYNRNPALAETQEGAFYENVGVNGPYVSDVVKIAVPARNWVALSYYYHMLFGVFGGICQTTGLCLSLDVPEVGDGRPFVNFMKIGNAVMRQGLATVRVGIAHPGRLQILIYDVAGRRVRTLADRVFPAGEQVLQWDGTDDAGAKVGRGVYFVRSSNEKGTGRIIVLNR
jgi:hypothetical protein